MVGVVNIGEFEEVVELLRCVTTKDTRGAKVETFTLVGQHMAKIETDAAETDADYNVFSAATVVITMYKDKDVSTRWRVRCRNTVYNIRSIDIGDRMSPFMRLTAEEVME